jgi:hypothetical protein
VNKLQKYIVWYNGWGIEVKAETIKQARHRAYVKFNKKFPVSYGEFMQGIEEVNKVSCCCA